MAGRRAQNAVFSSQIDIMLETTPLSDDENAPPPSLGTCVNFGVLAGSQLRFNTSRTILTSKSIGCTALNSINGNYKLSSGSVESATPAATICMNDKNKAYNSKSRCRYSLSPELAGRILPPGAYCSTTGKFTIRSE